MKKLHQTIRRYREDKGICRQEMADLLGLTLNGYGKIERGEVEVTISRLNEIGRILQVPIVQFIEEALSSNQNNDSLGKLDGPEKLHVDVESNFDPFVYIEFLESRINYLKSQLSKLH
jgi:transcriptional regulator with XRE-family HTH domain